MTAIMLRNANSSTPCTTLGRDSVWFTRTATPTPKSSGIPVVLFPVTLTPPILVNGMIRGFPTWPRSTVTSPAVFKAVYMATTIFSLTNAETTATPTDPPPPERLPMMSPWSSCSTTTPLPGWPAPSVRVFPPAPICISTLPVRTDRIRPGFINTVMN